MMNQDSLRGRFIGLWTAGGVSGVMPMGQIQQVQFPVYFCLLIPCSSFDVSCSGSSESLEAWFVPVVEAMGEDSVTI